MPKDEQWKSISDYKGVYEVSNLGRVRIVKSGRIRTPSPNHHGYLALKLQRKHAFIHRLVAAAFIGTCPDGMQVNHINGDKSDNRSENLEYVTPSENIKHAWRKLGFSPYRPSGESNGNSKLTVQIVRNIRLKWTTNKYTLSELGRQFDIHRTTVRRIVNYEIWKDVR
jgi:hypothetical protein